MKKLSLEELAYPSFFSKPEQAAREEGDFKNFQGVAGQEHEAGEDRADGEHDN